MSKSVSAPPPPEFTSEERDLLRQQNLTLEQFRDLLSEDSIGRTETQNLLKSVSGLYKETVTPGTYTPEKREFAFDPNLQREIQQGIKSTVLGNGSVPWAMGNDPLSMRQELISQLDRPNIKAGGGQVANQALKDAIVAEYDKLVTISGSDKNRGVADFHEIIPMAVNNVYAAAAKDPKLQESFGFGKVNITPEVRTEDKKELSLDQDAVSKLRTRITDTISYDEKIRNDAQKFLDEQINKPKTETEQRQDRIADLQSRIAENTLRQEAGLPPNAIPQDLYGTGAVTSPGGTPPADLGATSTSPSGTLPEITALRQALDKQQLQIANMQADRVQKALKGDVPISEATQQRKADEFETTKEMLRRNGHEVEGDTLDEAQGLTTPAVQTLDALKSRWALIEDAERQGVLQSGMSANIAQSGFVEDVNQGRATFNQASTDAKIGRNLSLSGYTDNKSQNAFSNAYNVRNLANRPTGSELNYLGMAEDAGPGGLLNSYQSLASGYGQAQQPYQNQRNMEYNTNMQNAANRAGLLSSLFGAAGTGLGAYFALASSKKFKKNIKKVDDGEGERILDLVKKGDTFTFDYKNEKGKRGKHLGLIAEKAPNEILTDDGDHLDVGNYLGLLTTSVRALARKVDRMSLSSTKEAA